MDTKILLENGTNELEVLEFTLDNNSYGINVAKIKEIIKVNPVDGKKRGSAGFAAYKKRIYDYFFENSEDEEADGII